MADGVTAPALAGVLECAFRDAAVPGVDAVYLFGSHASGRAHAESDVDVGVLLDRSLYQTPAARFEQRVRLSSWLSSALRQQQVDVVVLNDAPPLLARRVVTEGRRVFCAAPDRDRAFVRDAQLRAADIEPFLRRTRRLKLAAIRR